jgi:leader peptidase (prepilin peptidase) / N-methyltransferase
MALVEFPEGLAVGLALVLGLLFGSFTNVVIHRLPLGQNVAFPASHCPACGAAIAAYDNIPLVSFLMLRARARCCKAKIHWRYFVVELLGGMWAVAVMRVLILDLPGSTGLGTAALLFATYLALGLLLIAAIFIDLDHMILPDSLTLGGALLGIATSGLRDVELLTALVGAATGFSIIWLPFIELYRRVRGFPGMGLGDAKLLLLTGAWFGWQGAVLVLLAASLQGTLFALPVLLVRGRLEEPKVVQDERAEAQALLAQLEGEEKRALEAELAQDPLMTEAEPGLGRARLAFGPFLALATLEYLFLGEAAKDWLLRL